MIKSKYLNDGSAAEHLKKFGEPAPWMLTANGTRMRKYANTTIETFGKNGKDQTRKNFVEGLVAKIGIQYCGTVRNILAVTGPNIEKHLEVYIRSGLAKTMHVPEINPYTYEEIHKQAVKHVEFWNHNLCLHHASAQSFKVDNCNFVDMDLMQTFSQIETPVKSWLKFQSTFVQGKKAFAITAGIRKDGGDSARFNRVKKICKILDADLKSVDGVPGIFPACKMYAEEIEHLRGGYGKYCYSRTFQFSNMGRIDRVVGFSYADGSPMLCILILYK